MPKNRFRVVLTMVIAVLVVVSLTGCQTARQTQTDASSNNEQATEQSVTLDKGTSGGLEYLITLPKDYDANADQTWPVLVFLHFSGGGTMGYAEFFKLYQLVEDQGYSFITISPLTKGTNWLASEDDVILLVRNTIDKYKADPTRVYLSGGSMGATGTWTFAAKHPDLFAAAAPISAGASTDLAANLVDMPIWAFHNKNDTIVKVGKTQEMVDAVKNAGGKEVKFTIYEDKNDTKHDAWTKTFQNPDFYKWLLEHTNKNAS